MEKGLTKKKVQKFGISQQPRLFNSPRDFFILSLSISTGLLFFTIFLYIIIKISSFNFGSNKQKDSFEGEGENLDSLDDLLQDEGDETSKAEGDETSKAKGDETSKAEGDENNKEDEEIKTI